MRPNDLAISYGVRRYSLPTRRASVRTIIRVLPGRRRWTVGRGNGHEPTLLAQHAHSSKFQGRVPLLEVRQYRQGLSLQGFPAVPDSEREPTGICGARCLPRPQVRNGAAVHREPNWPASVLLSVSVLAPVQPE